MQQRRLIAAADLQCHAVACLTDRLLFRHADLIESLSQPGSLLALVPLAVSDLPTVDVFVHTSAVRSITPHEPLEDEDEERAVPLRLTVVTETVMFLEQTLPELKPAFLEQYRGVKARADDRGPDGWTQGTALSSIGPNRSEESQMSQSRMSVGMEKSVLEASFTTDSTDRRPSRAGAADERVVLERSDLRPTRAGQKHGGTLRHNRFSVQSRRSEALFVDYMAEHLTPSGRAGIIVPEGIIFQSQTAYKQLRKMLVEEHVVAVVSLPAGVFNPYSGVKTSILILDKLLGKKTDRIAFFKVENDGFDLGAQRRPIDKNDLPQAREEIAGYLQRLRAGEPVDDFEPTMGLIAAKGKIAANGDYNLSGERYRENGVRSSRFPIVPLGEVADVIAGRYRKSPPRLPTDGSIPRLVKILERPAVQQFAPFQRLLESAIVVGYVFQFSGRSRDGLEASTTSSSHLCRQA